MESRPRRSDSADQLAYRSPIAETCPEAWLTPYSVFNPSNNSMKGLRTISALYCFTYHFQRFRLWVAMET